MLVRKHNLALYLLSFNLIRTKRKSEGTDVKTLAWWGRFRPTAGGEWVSLRAPRGSSKSLTQPVMHKPAGIPLRVSVLTNKFCKELDFLFREGCGRCQHPFRRFCLSGSEHLFYVACLSNACKQGQATPGVQNMSWSLYAPHPGIDPGPQNIFLAIVWNLMYKIYTRCRRGKFWKSGTIMSG